MGVKSSDFKKPGAMLQNVTAGLAAGETGSGHPGTEHRTSATVTEAEGGGRDRVEGSGHKTKETLAETEVQVPPDKGEGSMHQKIDEINNVMLIDS